VEFGYLSGRFYTFTNCPGLAKKELDDAFKHCAASSMHNKRAILLTLIPAKMLENVYPTERLLQKYHLTDEFLPLLTALKTGNVSEYSRILLDKFDLYTSLGVFIWLNKLKLVVYRNIIKKVLSLYALLPHVKPDQITFPELKRALELAKVKMDVMELERVLVSLISFGYLKAYISHDQKTLVTRKLKPFPRLSELNMSQ